MFDINTETKQITMHRGDTGCFRIRANVTRKDTGASYTFGERDRAVFTLKSGSGQIVKELICPMTNNVFTVTFNNADTDKFGPGTYSWDVRYVINPYYDEQGKVVDGDQVLTPTDPLSMNLKTVVTDI